VNLRRDHVAGGAVVVAGALVLAISDDYPFGTLASPGAGMLPTLVIALLMTFGAVLFVRAGESPPLASISWTDLPHAVRVIAVASAAAALYATLGFIATLAALLFVLTFLVERKSLVTSVVFSIGVTLLAYGLFRFLLKIPVPRGLIWF
jgi:hypothetical protein